MSTYSHRTGSNIPGYYLGRPRSVYLERYRRGAVVAVIEPNPAASITEEVRAA